MGPRRFQVVLFLATWACLWPKCCLSAILRVPQDFTTFKAAIDVASSGDTIFVAPGIYSEPINYRNKALAVISRGGPDSTFLNCNQSYNTQVRIEWITSGTAIFSGFTVENSLEGTVGIEGCSAILANNVFRNNGAVGDIERGPVLTCDDATCLLTRNLFYNNNNKACVMIWGPYTSNVKIINNTFDRNMNAIVSSAGRGTILNNTITNTSGRGIRIDDGAPTNLLVEDYNLVHNNGWNYYNIPSPGDHDIESDPAFVSSIGHDYAPLPNSPCRDAGDPDAQYNDPDGSRSDIGAFSRTWDYPLALSIEVNHNIKCASTLTPTIDWQFADTGLSQTQYEIEVGTDTNWMVAELWSTGSLPSSSNEVVYAGAALHFNQPYFLRVRVADAFGWGSWNERQFELHQSHTVRVPSDYPNIQSGINFASDCDTVLVGPGVYKENIDYLGKPIVLQSEFGPDVTVLHRRSYYLPMIAIKNIYGGSAVLKGFRIEGAEEDQTHNDDLIHVFKSSLTITENVFRNTLSVWDWGWAVIYCDSASVTISRNIFYRNNGFFCVLVGYGSENTLIINNTFYENYGALYSFGTGGTAINNIIARSTSYGIGAWDFTSWTKTAYNNIWGNYINYVENARKSPTEISADPKFFNAYSYDFGLKPTSPCLNAGDPDAIYNDSDASRNDIGGIPSVHVFPVARLIRVDFGQNCDMCSKPMIRWKYFDSSSVQYGYQIQVSRDPSFSTIDMWDTGPIPSSTDSALFDGTTLVLETTYYGRIRVNNGFSWGGWSDFRILPHSGRVIRYPHDAQFETDFTCIQSAIDSAKDYDTVLIKSGYYSDNLNYLGKSISVIGEKGPDSTVLSPKQGQPIVQMAYISGGRPKLEGLTIRDHGSYLTNPCLITHASPDIERCQFTANESYPEVVHLDNSTATIRHCLFYGNHFYVPGPAIAFHDNASGVQITNNTFDGNYNAITAFGIAGDIRNNIITNSQVGINVWYSGTLTKLDYNNLWHNGQDCLFGGSTQATGEHSISKDPLYADTSTYNYALLDASPCIDAGDPDSSFRDPDGSIGDMGALYTATVPLMPRLMYPADQGDETVYDFHPNFIWRNATGFAADDTITHVINVYSNAPGAPFLKKDSLVEPAYSFGDSLFHGTKYYWKVGVKKNGALVNWTNPQAFLTWSLGDMDNSHQTDIADLTLLVDHLYISFSPISPLKAADLDGDCRVDISDLTRLIDRLYISFQPLDEGCQP